MIAFISMSFFWMHAQTNALPNDCINAITVCGNGYIASNAVGIGANYEINGNNSCNGVETNSLWLKINITNTGTLGFTLRPNTKNIIVDYDFYVFGPTTSCSNLGNSIRCSTTNPQAANLTNNYTGMNSSSTETAEGPGEDGDSFVKQLDVKVGETYYIMIDRFSGDGEFELEWNGSAATGGSPFPSVPIANTIPNHTECNATGSYTFDLNNYQSLINTNINNTISFFDSKGNAFDDNEPLSNIQNLNNESKTIYARVTNPNDCFDISSFEISAYKTHKTNSYTLIQCDVDSNNSTDGITHFNLLEAIDAIRNDPEDEIIFYKSISDKNNNIPITQPENYIGQDNEVIYTTAKNIHGCESSIAEELTLNVNPTTSSLPKTPYFACEEHTGTATFNLNDIKESKYSNLNTAFYNTLEDASLEINEIISSEITTQNTTLFVRIEDNNECQGIETIYLIVDEKPKEILPETIPTLCLNSPSVSISAENGFSHYEWIKLMEDGSEKTISNQQTVTVTSAGNYRLDAVKAYNDYGVIRECSNSETFHITASNIATISKTLVEDISNNNKVTIIVEGEGDYEYAIDSPYGSYQSSNTFENIPSGFIDVFVRDKNGCGLVKKTISVIGYDKFFTPNGDGYNDYWKINGTNNVFQSKSFIFIYDRYGKLIKQIRPSDQGWDGNFNGIPLPASDYWFSATLEDGRTFKGHFTLKR